MRLEAKCPNTWNFTSPNLVSQNLLVQYFSNCFNLNSYFLLDLERLKLNLAVPIFYSKTNELALLRSTYYLAIFKSLFSFDVWYNNFRFLYKIFHPKLSVVVVVVVGVVDIISLACKCEVHFLVCTPRPGAAVPVLLSGCRHHRCLDINTVLIFVDIIVGSTKYCSPRPSKWLSSPSFHPFMISWDTAAVSWILVARPSEPAQCGFLAVSYFWCFLSPSAKLLSPFTSHKVLFPVRSFEQAIS